MDSLDSVTHVGSENVFPEGQVGKSKGESLVLSLLLNKRIFETPPLVCWYTGNRKQ